jgi:hypothetical protein
MARPKPQRGKRPRDYAAEYARRIARAATKGLTRSQARGHPRAGEAPVSARRPLKPIPDERLQQALRVLRQDKSLAAAAKAAHVSPERLRHIAKSKGAIRKQGNRWIIDPDLPRRMPLFSRGRAIQVTVTGDAASKIGAYMDAVGKFLTSNNRDLLKAFVGQSVIDTAGKSHPLETNPNALYRLASAGEATFEQVYRIVVPS